jgi:hypothetical protein
LISPREWIYALCNSKRLWLTAARGPEDARGTSMADQSESFW